MKKLLSTILAGIFVFGVSGLSAQISVNVFPMAKISECQDAELVKIAVTNSGTSAITALSVTLPLQTNMNFVSVGTGTTLVTNSATSPVVTLAALPLASGATDTIRVWVRTICGYSTSLGATAPNITANGNYTNGSGAQTFSVNSFAQSRPFVAATPTVVYSLNPTNFQMNLIKDTMEVDIYLTQTNVNAYLRNAYAEFNYMAAGFEFCYATIGSNPTKITQPSPGSWILANGDYNFFKFNESHFLTVGDNDSFLESGDTIRLKARYVSDRKALRYKYCGYAAEWIPVMTFNFVAGYACGLPASMTNSTQFCRTTSAPYNPLALNVSFPTDRPTMGYRVIENGSSTLIPGAMDTVNHSVWKNISTGAEQKAGTKAVYDMSILLPVLEGATNGNTATNQAPWLWDTTFMKMVGFVVQGKFISYRSFPESKFKTCGYYLHFDADTTNDFKTDFDGPGGLSDIDGDGFYDDIAVGDSVEVYMIVQRTASSPSFRVESSGAYNAQNRNYTCSNAGSFMRDSSGKYIATISYINSYSGAGYGFVAHHYEAFAPGIYAERGRIENMKTGCASSTDNSSFTQYFGYQAYEGYGRNYLLLSNYAHPFNTTNIYPVYVPIDQFRTNVIGKGDSAWVKLNLTIPNGVEILNIPAGTIKDSISPTQYVLRKKIYGSELEKYEAGDVSTHNYCNVHNYQRTYGMSTLFTHLNFSYRLKCNFLTDNGGLCESMKNALKFKGNVVVYHASNPATLYDTIMATHESDPVALDFSVAHSCPVVYSNIYPTSFAIERVNYGWTDSTKSTPVSRASAQAVWKTMIFTGDTMNIMLRGNVATGTYDSVRVDLTPYQFYLNANSTHTVVDFLNFLSSSNMKVYRGGSLVATLPMAGLYSKIDSTSNWQPIFTGFTFLPGDSLFFDGYAILKNYFPTYMTYQDGQIDLRGTFLYKTAPGTYERCYNLQTRNWFNRPNFQVGIGYSHDTITGYPWYDNQNNSLGCTPFFTNVNLSLSNQGYNMEYREFATIDTIRVRVPDDMDIAFDALATHPFMAYTLPAGNTSCVRAKKVQTLTGANYSYDASSRYLTIVPPTGWKAMGSNSRDCGDVWGGNWVLGYRFPTRTNCKYPLSTYALLNGRNIQDIRMKGSFYTHNATSAINNTTIQVKDIWVSRGSGTHWDTVYKAVAMLSGNKRLLNSSSYKSPYRDLYGDSVLDYQVANGMGAQWNYYWLGTNTSFTSTSTQNTDFGLGQYYTVVVKSNEANASTSTNLFFSFLDTAGQIKIDSAWWNGSLVPMSQIINAGAGIDQVNVKQMITKGDADTIKIRLKYTKCSSTNIPFMLSQGCQMTFVNDWNTCRKMSTATYLPTPLSSTINVAVLESPTGTKILCDTLTYKVRLKSVNTGSADSVELVIVENPVAPGNVSIDPALSSFVFRGTTYPIIAGNIRSVAPNFLVYNLNPQLNALGTKFQSTDSAVFTLRIRTQCGFVVGSLTGFNVQGTQGCGSSLPIQANAIPPSFKILGADARYTTAVSLVKTIDTSCGMTKFKIKIANLGDGVGGTTDTVAGTDTMRIVVPKWYTYNASSSFTTGSNMPANMTPVTNIRTLDKVLSWPMKGGVVEGDSMVFDLSFTPHKDSFACSITNPVTFGTYNFNTVSCNAVPCATPIETGTALLNHVLAKPSLDILATSIGKLKCTDSVEINLQVRNNSTQVLNDNSVIRIFADVNSSNTVNSGDAYLRRMSLGTIGANSTATITFSVSATQYKNGVCNYIALIGKDSACTCASDTQVLNIVPDLLPDSLFICGLMGNLGPACFLNGMQYNWSTASPVVVLTNPTTLSPGFTASVTGTYQIALAMKPLSGSCALDTEYVWVRTVTASQANAGRDTTVCSGSTPLQIGAATIAGHTYSWSPAVGLSSTTISNPTLDRTTVATFTKILTMTNTATGCISKDTIVVDVTAGPSASITSSNAAMCGGNTRSLTATPSGGTFSGTGVSGTTFTAPGPGTYTITYTSAPDIFGCLGTASQTIVVNPKIGLSAITFSPLAVCVGSTTTASSTPTGGTWSVVSGPGTINASSGVLTATGSSAILVRYIHPGVAGTSCPDTVTGTITPTARPTAVITSATTAMCEGTTRALTGTPAGGTFTVVSGGGSIAGSTLTATSAGTISLRYSVTVSGCSHDTTVSIIVNALPTVAITSSNAAMCGGNTRTLTGTPSGGTFTGTGVSGTTFTAPATAGSYTINYSFTDANSCTNTATPQTIVVNPAITLSAVTFSKTTACVNVTGNSTASATPTGGSWSIISGPGSINPSTGAVTATGVGAIVVRYSHPGVSGTSCPNTVDGTINGVANPTVSMAATPMSVCYGASATIAATPAGTSGYSYTWSPNLGTSASISHSPTSNTNYSVTVTDANMCTVTGNTTVTVVGTSPLVANAGNDREICSGASTVLGGSPTGSGGAGSPTYQWNNALGAAANPSASPTATTTYVVTVTSSGCAAIDTVVVTVNSKPLIAPTATASSICIGNSTSLSAGGSGGTGALSYTWSNNASGTPVTVSPTVSTTYTVTVRDAKLCEAIGSMAITVNPLPVVSITSSGGNICQGSTRALVGSPAGGTFSGTGVIGTTFTAGTSGSYTITYTYTNPSTTCTNTATQTIVVDPSPVVNAGANDTICNGSSKTLIGSQTSSLTGLVYEWYVKGSTTPIPPQGTSVTVMPTMTTDYVFIGTKGNCSHTDTMTLGIVNRPDLIADMTTCQSATEDVAATWPLTNITANDNNSGVIKGGVSYTILSVKHGTASIVGTNINYQSNLNYNGFDTVAVVGTSNFCSGLKDTATFCINVASVNDAPIAVNDTTTTPMGVAVSMNLLTNDSDVDHILTGATVTILSGPNNGSAGAVDVSGNITYTPNPNFVGIDTVRYQVCDGGMPVLCATAFAYFNVTPKIADSVRTTNRNTTTPVVVGPTLSGQVASASVTPTNLSGTAVINPMTGTVTITPSSIPFIGKDTFIRIVEVLTTNGLVRDTSLIIIDNPNRGDTLLGTTNRDIPIDFPKLMEVNLKGTPLTPVVDPTLKINADGTVTYTPKAGFVGIDTAKIVRCDNLGNCHTMVYIVTVKPDLKDSATLTTQGSPVSVGLPITRYPGQSINTTVLNPTDNGTVVVNPDGSVTYTPNPNFVGRDTLVRQICIYDTASMTNICDTIRTIFTVLPKPLDDKTITAAGTPVTAGKPIATLPGTRTDITKTDPKNGTAVVNPDGTVTYTPKPGFVGSDTVKLTVCVYDSVSMKTVCNTTMVVFHVLPVNPDISTGTNINTPVTAGKPVVRIPGTSTDITKTGPSNGTATINPDGTITYTPKLGFIGKDTVTRIVCVYDSTSKKTICDTVKMYFSVYPTNPDTSVTTISGKPVTAGTPVPSLPGVRTDITLSGPTNGSAIVNPDGTVTYTPRLGFSGVDTIRRIICRYDSIAKTTYCDTSLIIVTVEPELAQIPNYFSPNGDGINDVWNLDGLLARYPNARAMVYNRWGNIVWRSSGPYGRSTSGVNNWYGQLEGSQDLVPDGVYYYLIEIEDEFKTTKTGFIEVMRQ